LFLAATVEEESSEDNDYKDSDKEDKSGYSYNESESGIDEDDKVEMPTAKKKLLLGPRPSPRLHLRRRLLLLRMIPLMK
jgi:hypothetical protein